MKIQIDPLAQLQFARESLALESFSLRSLGNSLKELLPGIRDAFASNKVAVSLPPMVTLSSNQGQFLKLIASFPYTDLRVLTAYRPEGMCVNYLQYLAVLLPITEYLKGIQAHVTSPYLLFLAQVVSDKQAAISTNSQETQYKQLEAFREASYAAFAKLYAANSYAAVTTVGEVVDRNADWKTVFEQATQCAENMKAVNLSAVQSQLQQCSDYLTILHTELNDGKRGDTSIEAAQRLSNGAYQVAKELEFFSSTHYRTLALNGCLDNTVKHITESIG